MRQPVLLFALLALLSLPFVPGCSGGAIVTDGPVQGTVLDVSGAPVSGAPVKVGSTLLTTDENGRFTSGSVPAFYDLALATPDRKHAYVYDGLTARAPTIVLDTLASAWRSATVHVALAPAGSILIATLDGVTARRTMIGTSDGGVDLILSWSGTAQPALMLTALHFVADHPYGAPSHFDGYATLTEGLDPGAKLDWSPALVAPTFGEHVVQIQASAPVLTGAQAELLIAAPGYAAPFPFRVPTLVSDGTRASILVPEIPGARIDLSLSAVTPEGYATALVRDLVTKRDPVTVTFAPALSPVAPEDNATGFTVGDSLAWSAPPGEVARVYFFPLIDSGSPDVTMLTAATSHAVPALDELGVVLPAGAVYAWNVTATPGIESTDEATARQRDDAWGPDAVVGTTQRELTLK